VKLNVRSGTHFEDENNQYLPPTSLIMIGDLLVVVRAPDDNK